MVRRCLYRLNHEFHEYHVLAKKSGLSAAYSSVSCWSAARSCSIAGDRNYCTPVTRRPFRLCSSYSGEVRPTPTQLHGGCKVQSNYFSGTTNHQNQFLLQAHRNPRWSEASYSDGSNTVRLPASVSFVFLLSLAVMQTGSSHYMMMTIFVGVN